MRNQRGAVLRTTKLWSAPLLLAPEALRLTPRAPSVLNCRPELEVAIGNDVTGAMAVNNGDRTCLGQSTALCAGLQAGIAGCKREGRDRCHGSRQR